MKLELTLVSAPSGSQLDPEEISVDIADGAAGSELVQELSRRFPARQFCRGRAAAGISDRRYRPTAGAAPSWSLAAAQALTEAPA